MKALVVRKKSDNSLVCFGPDNGMYDPGFDATTMVKSLEGDYDAVKQEWFALLATKPSPTSRKAAIQNANTLAELKAALADLL